MEKQESINSWKTGESKYNSLFDELARHLSSKHKLKFKNYNLEQVWDAFLRTFSKMYSVPLNQIAVNRKFTIKSKTKRMSYTISDLEVMKKFKYIGQLNQDKYDTTFEFTYRKWLKKTIISYKEHILREKTMTGLSDQFNKIIFRRSARRNKKLLKKAINYQLGLTSK